MLVIGASHYGISDLSTLAADTHKLESRYCDGLVGPWPGAKEVYERRSPIHHVDRLATPLILLQGLDDKVVLPSQAEAMAAVLRPRSDPTAFAAAAKVLARTVPIRWQCRSTLGMRSR